MIDLKNIDDVKGLQSNLRASLDTPQGKEVISFLEEICGWYDFSETDPNVVKARVSAYFKDPKHAILISIAKCESDFRQFDSKGNIHRGVKNSRDVGVMQINEIYHLDTSLPPIFFLFFFFSFFFFETESCSCHPGWSAMA